MNRNQFQWFINLPIFIIFEIIIIVIGCQVTKKAENFCKDSGAKYGYEPSKITYDGKCCYEYLYLALLSITPLVLCGNIRTKKGISL